MRITAAASDTDTDDAVHSFRLRRHRFQENKQRRSSAFDNIPSLDDVSEMGNLSGAIYKYHWWIDEEQDKICDDFNKNYNNNSTTTTTTTTTTTASSLGDVVCHWYRHDRTMGTQVMIVTSHRKDYLAVVFAGTDDLKTSLLDVDVRKTDFGTSGFDDHKLISDSGAAGVNASLIPVALKDCPDCKVHSGFNSAVFGNHIFDDIYERVEKLRPRYQRLFTTGHSLGAANAVFVSLALALQMEEKHIPLPRAPITTINFGCPQLGNAAFRDYVNEHYLTHSSRVHRNHYLSIWRFVLGWDLVPRLPDFFEHIGHTVQLQHDECTTIGKGCNYNKHHHHHHSWIPTWNHSAGDNNHTSPDNDSNITKEGLAYYHHIGNVTLGLASVPTGWSAKPYVWVPGALLSHAISKYAAYVNDWLRLSATTYVSDFVHTSNDSSDDKLIDDDAYAEPPDDDAATEMILDIIEKKMFR